LRNSKYKYIWASDSSHEIYNLEKDPGEEENLIAKFPHQAEAIQKTLNQWLASVKIPTTKGTPRKIDKETTESLRVLGYIK